MFIENHCVLYANSVWIIQNYDNIGKRVILIISEPENIGNQVILITREFGNTGIQVILITREPGNIGTQDILMTWKPGNVGTCILKNIDIRCIIEGWLFDMISKKTRAEKWCNLAAVSRRDLSYETDSGPKTKTGNRPFSRPLKKWNNFLRHPKRRWEKKSWGMFG